MNEPPRVACSKILKVLADEVRLRTLRELLAGPRHVSAINEAVGVEKSLLSHHLRVLRDAGLVESTRQGKTVLYSLAPSVVVREGGGLELGCCRLVFDRRANRSHDDRRARPRERAPRRRRDRPA